MAEDTPNNCPSGKTFARILVAIILGWILINLWTTCLEAICYHTLGLSKHYWLHTLIIAGIGTGLFLVYVHCVEERDTIRTKMTGMVTGPPDPSASMTD